MRRVAESDKETKEKFERSADFYKNQLESDLVDLNKRIEKIIKIAAVTGGIALIAYSIFSKNNDQKKPDDDDSEFEASKMDQKETLLGSIGKNILSRVVEIAVVLVLNEAKEKLHEYIKNLGNLEESINNDESSDQY